MKSKREVFSDIFYLDTSEKVFNVYHFKEILNIFMTTFLSLFNFALMALTLLQFQKSDVDQTAP